jgi:hypothetical protein
VGLQGDGGLPIGNTLLSRNYIKCAVGRLDMQLPFTKHRNACCVVIMVCLSSFASGVSLRTHVSAPCLKVSPLSLYPPLFYLPMGHPSVLPYKTCVFSLLGAKYPRTTCPDPMHMPFPCPKFTQTLSDCASVRTALSSNRDCT